MFFPPFNVRQRRRQDLGRTQMGCVDNKIVLSTVEGINTIVLEVPKPVARFTALERRDPFLKRRGVIVIFSDLCFVFVNPPRRFT